MLWRLLSLLAPKRPVREVELVLPDWLSERRGEIIEALSSRVIPGLEADPVTLGLVERIEVSEDGLRARVLLRRGPRMGRGLCWVAGELLWHRVAREVREALESLGFIEVNVEAV